MMDLQRKDMIIAVGVTIGAAVLVLFMRNRNSASSGGSQNGGVSDIAGGFQTSSTVFVPTSSYDLQFNDYKGSVTYSSVTNNNQSTTTTTYAPVDSNNNSPIASNDSAPVSAVVLPLHTVDSTSAPIITTGSNNVINLPTSQTNTTPTTTAPVAPAPPIAPQISPVAQNGRSMGTLHYAEPSQGWNPNSVVDYIKSKGGYSDFASRGVYWNQSMGQSAAYTGSAAQNIQMLHSMEAVYGQGGFN